jgi:ribosomal-protein-alanine N-acetyltransferase
VVVDGYEIRPLAAGDAPALAAAYRRNREHLAPWDPQRPERFYTDEGHAEEVAAQLVMVAAGRLHTWVLWHGDVAVGRIGLNNIVRGVMLSATVGYWVDREHTGRGVATGAVEYAAARAEELGLHRLEAGTLLHNTRSQAVLQRAGFQEYGVAEQLLFIAGKWQDHVLFQRILHDRPVGNPVS